ncbi:MAG: hypothetical protein ACKV19_29775 [Verrucomicrobiales bacterium]
MSEPTNSPIVCPTTPWYARRKLLMFAMLAAFAGWFYKDYKWGYPEKARIYAEYKKVIAQPDGLAQWEKIAGENGWNKQPDEITPDKIGEQGKFAVGLGLGALAVLVTFLINRGKKLTADADTFTPAGSRTPIPFASVTRVDKTRWKHKGLAYAYYKDAGGAERKAVIDDLKFAGADQVLDRLLGRFGGEIIDVAEEPPPPADNAQAGSSSTPG